MTGRWFSPNTLVSSNNKTERQDITEILLKVALNTIQLKKIITIAFHFMFIIRAGACQRYGSHILWWLQIE
jgi:hypothetical protein